MDFYLPPWGEAAVEATVTRVLVVSGDPVEKEAPFIELATEKVDFELPAPVSGLVGELYVKEHSKVTVGDKIATFYSADAYSQTEYTIYMAVRNIRKMDVNRLCSREAPSALSFEILFPTFRELMELAHGLRGLFLRRLSENAVNELQGTMYKIWSCINRVRRFQLDRNPTSSMHEEVIRHVETTLPGLLFQLNQIREFISRPRMFIGSSRANVEYANSIRDQIGPQVRCRVWSEDEAFPDPKSTTVHALLEAPTRYDYAVFVIGAREDQSRQLLGLRVRDLLICTLGVFLARLGRERVRIIKAQNEVLHFLDDLVVAHYDPDAGIGEEMAKACDQILPDVLHSIPRVIEK